MQTPDLRPVQPSMPPPAAVAPAIPRPIRPAQPEVQEPQLDFPQGAVDLSAQVSANTGLLKIIGYAAAAIAALAVVVSSGGVFLLAILVSPVVEWFRWRKVRAMIRGSGIHVSAEQLPWLHQMVVDFSRRLGMKKIPEVYILEDSMQNGVAFKLGTKDIVVLTDDVVWGALQSKDPHSLGFVVGHELAHIAHGHTKTLRSFLGSIIKPLGRADEYTADNTAAALVGDPRIAAHGLTVVTVGPQLLRYINDDALLRQAREVAADKHAKKAERTMSHPLLLQRIANVMDRPWR